MKHPLTGKPVTIQDVFCWIGYVELVGFAIFGIWILIQRLRS